MNRISDWQADVMEAFGFTATDRHGLEVMLDKWDQWYFEDYRQSIIEFLDYREMLMEKLAR